MVATTNTTRSDREGDEDGQRGGVELVDVVDDQQQPALARQADQRGPGQVEERRPLVDAELEGADQLRRQQVGERAERDRLGGGVADGPGGRPAGGGGQTQHLVGQPALAHPGRAASSTPPTAASPYQSPSSSARRCEPSTAKA